MKERYVNIPGFPEKEQFTPDMEAAREDARLASVVRKLDDLEKGARVDDLDKLVDHIADVCDAYHLNPDEMGVVLSHMRRAPADSSEAAF